ncbi:hypothetical protein CM19_04375 [Candidatus Acidianus copahuensis]|uniref:Uncharacterized protein n=1 Tax=Candidatus Acidianus copahuensis TaxID=1160895 RepID=A0A031LQU5_9CREN|nr:hypothetical protein [Candidatus Acidianus copahuensis]EZQ10186.1 hypothetical protein CM19_04375 [Candidatus Acidianus copahuensis]
MGMTSKIFWKLSFARRTMIMKTIPPESIGRSDGTVQVLTIITEIILLIFYITTVDILSPGFLIQITGFVVLTSIILAIILY